MKVKLHPSGSRHLTKANFLDVADAEYLKSLSCAHIHKFSSQVLAAGVAPQLLKNALIACGTNGDVAAFSGNKPSSR